MLMHLSDTPPFQGGAGGRGEAAFNEVHARAITRARFRGDP